MNPRKDDNKKKKTKNRKSEYEFCKVCKLNHDQGPRHKYFPRHKQSLSAFLDRFKTKIADVRFFLKNPSVLRPEYASHNRIWCVFCDEDVDESGSSFACCNAINHLASDDHLRNLKDFLWKSGGSMDRVDKFRISRADVAEWEKKCRSLKHESASSRKRSCGFFYGPPNDIHNELKFKTIDKYELNPFNPSESNYANCVMPLQYNTNEYQIPASGPSEGIQSGMIHAGTYSYTPNYVLTWTNSCSSSHLTGATYAVNGISQQSTICSSLGHSGYDLHSCREVCQDGNGAMGSFPSLGLQSLTPVLPMHTEEVGGNVHSGAPPPWFDTNDENHTFRSSVSAAKGAAKSRKKNPNRVGASWAEKRKLELEMEKRGEMTRSSYDDEWLPNFGRVWQSGSRKESRKDFENEQQKSVKAECTSELATRVQPYVSERRVESTSELATQIKPYVSKRRVESNSGVAIQIQPYVSKRRMRDDEEC